MSARLAAAELLLSLERGRTTLGAELEDARADITSRQDRALLLELAAGTLRWRAQLDALIEHASKRPVARLQVEVRTVLRVGAYQIFHLDRIPAHAVVSESVETIRRLRAPHAVGLINAVLRALTRLDPATVLPPRPDEKQARRLFEKDAGLVFRDHILDYLSITLSHPRWLVERWVNRYGFEATERWCQFNNATPAVTVRPVAEGGSAALHRALLDAHVEASPARFVSDALRLAPGALGKVPATLRDQFHVQDEGAQLVARCAGVRPGERVLDACAAPGGKTMVLGHDLALGSTSTSQLVAADMRRSRVELLARMVARAGLRVPVVAHDASRPLPYSPVFDCVVLDVPCSGLGTIRRDPDLKWTRAEGDLSALAHLELGMLEAACQVVRPGGRLLYATCSSEPDENRAVVEHFLSDHPDFSLQPVTASGIPADLTDDAGCLATRPDLHQLDAFFAALLVRRAA